jgi:hypothetical protein
MTSDKFKGVRLNLEPGTLRVASNNAEQEEAWTSSTSTTATPSRSAST